MNATAFRTLVRAWITIALVDGVFATVFPVLAYGQPLGRVWKGVASVLLGASAMDGGARTLLIGLAMHAGVAMLWTTVFVALALLVPRVRRLAASWGGAIALAAVYGPFVWMMMSLVVIPQLTGRPPTINGRWWTQLLAHVPFVALPIVATVGRGLREGDVAPVRRAAESAT